MKSIVGHVVRTWITQINTMRENMGNKNIRKVNTMVENNPQKIMLFYPYLPRQPDTG